jgi:serine/threonine protein kinase
MSPMTYRAPALDEPALPTLKKYRLLGQLARGGMADVFLARADGIGGFERLLVIKRILPELASDTELVRMFLDEARTAATLHHAHIVQVHEVDVADGHVFYAMEHLHGQDVATTLHRLASRERRLPLGNAIAITVAVAAGLHYAHERCASDGHPLDIVHRDVAPGNVVVTYDGNIKLIDFGIAKAANNLSRTRFGLFKGRLPYASPEQCRCEPVDRRTDVFSLGVMLYELTTGERLFTADNEYDLLRVVSEAVIPRPRLRDKAYPRALEAIVLQALARDRDDRYPSAQALQHELEVFADALSLDLSATSLSRLMESLFGDELAQWRTAERAGQTLEQHLITTTTQALSLDRREVDRELAEVIAAAQPGPEVGSPTTSAVDATPSAGAVVALPTPQLRSRVTTYALIAIAASGLVVAGALGALWAANPQAAPAPEVTRAHAAEPKVSVVAPASASPVVAPASASPVVAPASASPAPPLIEATRASPAVPAPAPIEADDASVRHPARRPKHVRPRAEPAPRAPAASAPAPHAPAASAPAVAQPVEHPRPVLDDAALDTVVPRSTRSP